MHTPSTKAELKEFLEYESKRYHRKNTRIPIIEIGEERILWKFVALLRYNEYYYNSNKKIRNYICRFLLARMRLKYGLGIPLNVFGKGLRLVHIGRILINSKSVVGENCVLHINTALVGAGRNDNAPVVGDNVIICVGATLVGGVNIKNGCVIGANSLVNKTIDEENIAIAGNPARKVSDNGAQSWER